MTPATVLVRARNIEVRIDGADDIHVVRGDERLEHAPHALAVLDAFAQPRSVATVLDDLATNQEEWIEVSSTIYQLGRAGILVDPGAPDTAPRGYASPPIHVAMLDDHARTRGFIDALRATVSKDDVVLDIGTGTGVLATVAAQLGACRVHAIESSAIGEVAQSVFTANGVADRVNLVRGRSTSVDLPERASLLVTELIGDDPLDEGLLEVVHDAKKRLLIPGARIIPAELEIFGVPVDVPSTVCEERAFTLERIAAWREMYGVDFAPLMSVKPTASQPTAIKTADLLRWPRVAAPVSLARVDLTKPFELRLETRATFALDHDVACLGIALAFRATLAPGRRLSTLPREVDPKNHWRYGLFALHERLRFTAGTTVTIDYRYDRGRTTLSVT